MQKTILAKIDGTGHLQSQPNTHHEVQGSTTLDRVKGFAEAPCTVASGAVITYGQHTDILTGNIIQPKQCGGSFQNKLKTALAIDKADTPMNWRTAG